MRKSSHDLQNLNYYQLKLSPFSNRHDLHALLYFSKKYHEHFLKVHNVLEFIRRLFSGTGCSINTINKQCDGIQNKRVEHDPFFIRYRRVIGRIIMSSILKRVPLMLKEWRGQGNVF